MYLPTYSSKKIGRFLRAGFEPTSPCILVRRGNHYTIRDLYASNVARGNIPIFSDEYVGKIKTYLFFLSSYESFTASKNTYSFEIKGTYKGKGTNEREGTKEDTKDGEGIVEGSETIKR